MADFADQLRNHYDGKSLPAEKAEAILARGRSEGGHAAGSPETTPENVIRTASFRRWLPRLAVAAAVTLLFGFAGWWSYRQAHTVAFSELPVSVVAFFAAEPRMEKAPQDKTQLRELLIAKGAPAELRIPAKLMPLETAACNIVDVRGCSTWLACFWRDDRAGRGDHDLVHLLVGKRSDFRGEPGSATAEWRELNGWSFASWSEGEIVYTLAAATPPEKLRPFVAVGRAQSAFLAVLE